MSSLTQEITFKTAALPEIMQYEVLDFISYLYEKLTKSQPNALLELTLEQLLAESPQTALALTPEDKEWLNAPATGRENERKPKTRKTRWKVTPRIPNTEKRFTTQKPLKKNMKFLLPKTVTR